MDPDAIDHITFAPNLSTRHTIPPNDETRTLATAHEGDDYFEEADDIDPALTNKMTRSRTIEEVDLHHTFKRQDVIDAENEPRRHNVIFISMMMCFLVGAFLSDGLRGTTYPEVGDGDEVAEPEEEVNMKPRWAGRGDGNGLGVRCTTAEGVGTTGTGFGTGTGFSILPTSSISIYPTASSAGTGTIPTGSMPTAAMGTAPAASSAPCSKEGDFLCNGPQFFGICSHGTVIWQHVAEGTECQGGKTVGTGSYAQPTVNPPIRRDEVRSYTNTTTTSIPAGTPSVAGSAAAVTSSVCSAPDGMLVCNGPDSFGLCSNGTVVWQPVDDDTECWNGRIVEFGAKPTTASPSHGLL